MLSLGLVYIALRLPYTILHHRAAVTFGTDILPPCLARCVRPDETSATVRCHYLTDGTANFAFTMRRQEFFVPVGILLKCFLEVSDRELSEKLLACCAEVRSLAAPDHAAAD